VVSKRQRHVVTAFSPGEKVEPGDGRIDALRFDDVLTTADGALDNLSGQAKEAARPDDEDLGDLEAPVGRRLRWAIRRLPGFQLRLEARVLTPEVSSPIGDNQQVESDRDDGRG
jgi:hypothetical protein